MLVSWERERNPVVGELNRVKHHSDHDTIMDSP